MSSIYQKTATDKTCILAPREYFLRPFNFLAWTEARFGLFFGGVTAAGDNTSSTSESVAKSSVSDIIAFGIKNSSTSDLPGQAGSLFLGVTSDNDASCTTFGVGAAGGDYASISGNPAFLVSTGYNGVTKIGGTDTQACNGMHYPTVTSGATNYCGFFGLKFVINNIGLSTQSVTLSSSFVSTVSGSDYSAAALRTLLNNSTYNNSSTLTWNDGVSARAIPDALYLRMPFYNNRIRVSSMMGVRYAP